MKTAKKALAVVCITVFTMAIISIPRSMTQHPTPPGDYAYLIGQLMGVVLVVGFLFFSVRWYMTLSGYTLKVGRQAWAAILFWYSLLGVLIGLSITRMGFVENSTFTIVSGAVAIGVWILVGSACWKWKKRLRAAEKTVQASAASAV